jgi:hypothetical protein
MLLGTSCHVILATPLNAQPAQDLPDKKLDKKIETRVFYGPGLLASSKEIILTADSTLKESNRNFQVAEGDESFDDVKNWIAKNVLYPLNEQVRHFDESTHYSLFLFSERNKGINGLSISVPLGEGILGSRFSEKLEELRDLMSTKK